MRVQNIAGFFTPEYFTCDPRIICPGIFYMRVQNIPEFLPRNILHAGAKYRRIFCPGIFYMRVQNIAGSAVERAVEDAVEAGPRPASVKSTRMSTFSHRENISEHMRLAC